VLRPAVATLECLSHVRAVSKADRRGCPFCPCAHLGPCCHGRRAVSGHPRQYSLIDPVLCDRRIRLGIAGNAAGQLDVRTNGPAITVEIVGILPVGRV